MNFSKQRKLGLVQVNDIISGNMILPLAIGVLWQSVCNNAEIQKTWQLRHVVYAADIENDLENLADCDIVCFSTYVWNADYHVELAHQLREKNPSCFIMFGGPHFTSTYADFWSHYQGVIDLVIQGEGEQALEKLLHDYDGNLDLSSIPGAWTPSFLNTPAPRVTNLHQIPSPYLSGFYDHMIRYAQNHGLRLQAVLQTNRGCPYHCTFCEEGVDYKNKIFVADLHTIKKEITWMGQNQIEYLSLADDNWGIYQHDIDLMRHICETKLTYGYPRIVDATYAKNNPKNVLAIAQVDRELGTDLIRGITVALQSTHQPTLDSIRRFNLEPSAQRDFVCALRELGMPIYVEFIWPLPKETWQHFRRGIDSTLQAGLDTWIMMYPLGIHTGTQLWQEYHDDYEFGQRPKGKQSERMYIGINKVVASKWVSHDGVVHGHVFFSWLATLYFFGFARRALKQMSQSLNLSVCELIEDFMIWIQNLPEQDPLRMQQDRLWQYWSKWLHNETTEPLGQFAGQDMDFWYPYTHHASWLQLNHACFMTRLSEWMLTRNVTSVTIEKWLEDCWHGTVRYEQTYPYEHDGAVIELNHVQPKFDSCHEFCRYYYWWNRKKGYSVTRRVSNRSKNSRSTPVGPAGLVASSEGLVEQSQ